MVIITLLKYVTMLLGNNHNLKEFCNQKEISIWPNVWNSKIILKYWNNTESYSNELIEFQE